VADVAWDFEAEAKFGRGFIIPACYVFGGWDGVKGGVAFNCCEASAV
jgi:hypothetical protein